jgi:hypothetical protein
LVIACVSLAGCDTVLGLERHECWGQWMAGRIMPNTPRRIAELADGAPQRYPSIAHDGLTLYFDQGVTGRGLDIFAARRAAIGASWEAPVAVDELNSAREDQRLSLDASGTIGMFTTERGGAQIFDIWSTTREATSDPFSEPSRELVGMANTTLDDHGAELSADGLSLYFAPYAPSGQSIQVATRSSTTLPFGRPAPVAVDGLSDFSANPALSPDERVMVFVSGQGTNDLYYAVRPSRVATFGAPVQVPNVNAPGVFDGESEVSADGCEIYFVSERGGRRELYVSELDPD